MRVLRAAAVAVTIGVLTGGASPAPRSLRLGYDIAYGGISVVQFEILEQSEGGRYRMDFAARTVGIANLVLHAVISGSVEGKVEGGAVRPNVFVSDSSGQTKRHTRLEFQPDGEVTAELTPKPEAADHAIVPIPQDTLRGSIDPLSGILLLAVNVSAADPCQGAIPVFDGRRRYDLVLRPAGPTEVTDESEHLPVQLDGRCAVHRTMLGGQTVNPRKRLAGNDATVWMGRVRPDLPPVPVEIAFKTKWGVMRARLLSADADPGAAPAP